MNSPAVTSIRRAAMIFGLVALGICLLLSFARAGEPQFAIDIKQSMEITDHDRRLERLESIHADTRLVKLETLSERNNTLLIGLAIAIAPIALNSILGLTERSKAR